MVPAGEVVDAVAVAVLPAVAVVLTERTELPTVQVAVAVDGVTVSRFHVVLAPV
jgi:hypothetical protein